MKITLNRDKKIGKINPLHAVGQPPIGGSYLEYPSKHFHFLTEAGVPMKHKEYPDAVHGFVEIYFSGRMKSQFWLGKSLIRKNEELAWDFIREVKAFVEDASAH